ncbi:hypothetical protein [Halomonas sp. HG01]|uniref:hypothetical protein n=1 Tax=Halomonas sp. HG01 TaxID=1609967 RepID=UPI00128DD2B2|nr:hypothetical protein [Halomonas sp. HG01]
MTDRYFGKVVSKPDGYRVVVNKGYDNGVEVGQKFLVVGIGDVIRDPDTGEELEKLEIVRGRVVVDHVQQKISTLKSCEYEVSEETKEIKKVSSRGGLAVLGPQDTVTESIKPGSKHLKPLQGAGIGDLIIKL